MDYGDLTSYKNIDEYFKVLCDKSKQEIVEELFCDKQKIAQQKENLEKDISDAFCLLFGKFTNSECASVAQRISRLFGIDLKELESKERCQREGYVRSCIETTVQRELALNDGSKLSGRKYTPAEVAKADRNHKQKFGWIELKTKYAFLKETFEEILLEKVREFDQELEEMVSASKCRKQASPKITAMSSARKDTAAFEEVSIQNTELALEKVRGSRSLQQFRPITATTIKKTGRNSPSKRLNPEEPKFNFSNVAIRDTTKFTLKKWGRSEQNEFRNKKNILRSTFHKTSNTPIIFQFVKKYTQTVKARDHLMNRWHDKDDLNEEQLRYLCATSVFLNQSINRNQKQQIKQKINTLNRDMLSRLEVNIAQKIIETYRIFTNKVSDMRKNYYLQLTASTKTNQKLNASQLAQENRKKERYQQYLVYKKRLDYICNSASMKWRLNYRVMRWVNHFIAKLKQKIGKKLKTSRMRKVMSSNLLMRLHKGHPSSKVIKKEIDKDVMHFERPPEAAKTINTDQFNSVKYRQRSAYLKHLSSGPKRLATSLVYVDLLNKTAKCDATALSLIIYIQACWRRRIVMRDFKPKLERFRQERAAQFQEELHKLKYLYPQNRRIVFPYIAKRLKNSTRLALAAFHPYIRHCRSAKYKYSHFFTERALNEKQLEMKYLGQTMNKLASKVKILMDCAVKNEFERLMNSGFVLSAKELNATVGGRCPLHAIAQHGNINFGQVLLDGGANPNLKDKEGNTPLHVAFAKKDSAMIFLLLDYGADLNMLNCHLNTPLFYAPRELLASLGLQDGFVSGQNARIDNNQLYYRKMHQVEDQHLEM